MTLTDPICIVVSDVSRLGSLLNFAAAQRPESLHLLLISEEKPLQEQIRRHYLYACWKQQGFDLHEAFPVLFHNQNLITELGLPSRTRLLTTEDVPLRVSGKPTALATVLAQLAQQGHSLDQDLQAQAMQQPVQALLEASELVEWVQKQLTSIQNESTSAVPVNDYRFLMALDLHKSQWFRSLRPTLNRLIQRLLNQPEAEQLHLALSLFRRRHVAWERYVDSWSEPQCQLLPPEQLTAHCPIRILEPPVSQRVAIFMPTYQRLEGFKQAVACVLAQTYRNWEVHIYDDVSSDGTQNYCRELVAQDPRFHYHRNTQNLGFLGIQKSYRLMADLTECELITALCDDDRWARDHLENLMRLFQIRPWVAEVFSSFYQIQYYQIILREFGPFETCEGMLDPMQEFIHALQLDTCPVGAIMRKHLFAEFEAFDLTSQRTFGASYAAWDYMLHIKLLSSYELAHSPKSSMYFNVSPDTGSANWDSTADLLDLLAVTRQDYQTLFHEELPPEVISAFLRRRCETVSKQFRNMLLEAQPEHWQAFLNDKQPVWERLRALQADLPAPNLEQQKPLHPQANIFILGLQSRLYFKFRKFAKMLINKASRRKGP